MSVEEKAFRVVTFDGKAENWRTWKLKIMAKALIEGFRDVFEGKVVVPDESEDIDVSTDAGKKSMKYRNMNNKAYATLAMACDGVSFGCVERAITNKLPSGDAGLAWKNLCTKYEPSTQMSLVSLKKEFAECKLESVKSDPDEWITKLEHIRIRIKGIQNAQPIDDDNMMAHILANLPKGYSELITTIESELDQSNKTITVDMLVERIRNYYRRKFENSTKNEKGVDEVALVAF